MSEIPLKSKMSSLPLSKGVLPSKNLNGTSEIKKAPQMLLQKMSALKGGDSLIKKQVVSPSTKIVTPTKLAVGKDMSIIEKALPAKKQIQLLPPVSKPSILKEVDTGTPSTLDMKAPNKTESKLELKTKNDSVKAQATTTPQLKLANQIQVKSGVSPNNVNDSPKEEKPLLKAPETNNECLKLPPPNNIKVSATSPTLNLNNNHNLVVKNTPMKDSYSCVISKNNELPSTYKCVQNNTNDIESSNITNMKLLDPAIWQMVTTIATICSTACQNNCRSTSRHCCKRRHSRKNKKDNDSIEKNVSTGVKECSEVNELKREEEPEMKATRQKVTGKKDGVGNQCENIVSGTKWHGIEKKLANIRGLRDLNVDSGDYDDELIETNNYLSQGASQPRYYEEDEFPTEIPTMGSYRRYLAKEGIYKSSRFSKSPFVGGLSAARRRPYSSLTEMAAYFSNIEPQDQNDVIVMLLACRKLEKQIEEQQVIMQLLEHDLREAQSLLRFPPEWRSLNSVDVIGHPPLPIGQIPPTSDPPYVSNHPRAESPWMVKRPKEGLPSRSPTKL
ncbi:putative low complexity [Cryptosporidium xiaoi]|uniref:Low complexity n=1 Tax=Cryptosporidium xiaoi TaxID=659607 RepID=A0AAV9XYP3_9CRYT